MAIATWPTTLPQRLEVSGYGEGIGDGRLRSQMDTGPAKVRRRSSAMPRMLSGTIMMTGPQILIAKSFVENTLVGGSFPFNFPDPLTEIPVPMRIAGDMPSWSAVSGLWFRWSMSLEVLP